MSFAFLINIRIGGDTRIQPPSPFKTEKKPFFRPMAIFGYRKNVFFRKKEREKSMYQVINLEIKANKL